jgi:acetoin utilization deacetylase AcuC-like enzyme
MLKASNKLGVIFFPAFDWAITSTHPERQERLLYTMDQLKEEGVFDISGILEFKPDKAELDDIRRVHFCYPDTGSNVTDSHLISAGGAIKAARLFFEGEEDKAFALVRPPGHHAMKSVHGGRGFCNVNIEAVMIEYMREHYGIGRVAVVDTDCHHGDGTQDIYWHDPDTLYISLHQDGRTLFPGTGFPRELGGPKALGRTLNAPLPPGTSDEGFLKVVDDIVMPVLEDFQPEVVINSAGQDNHYTDPITDMNFSAQGYAALSRRLNPDIAVLEGGYSIQGALPYINLGIVLAMAGLDFSHVREPDYDPDRLKQDKKIGEYVDKLSEILLYTYFRPPKEKMTFDREGDYFVRSKEIFYDTAFITEQQKEYLLDCDDCRGVLYVESSSSRCRNCLGIEVPYRACERCAREGRRLYRDAAKKGRYANIQLIDRVEGQSYRQA